MRVSISSSSVAIKSSAESWLSITTSAILDHLRGMDRGRDRGRSVDEPELAKDALFEIGEARALAGAPAAPRHRDAADDAEVELRHVLEADRLAMLQEALRGGGGLEIDALRGELLRVDAQIGKALGQIGDGREQQLAVVERPQPHRDLRRIGIALDDARPLPGVEFAQPLGGDVGADEIRDAVESRPDIDSASRPAAPRRDCGRRPSRCCVRPSADAVSIHDIAVLRRNARNRGADDAVPLEGARDARAQDPRARAAR